MNIIYEVGKENQEKFEQIHTVKAPHRKSRPFTAKEERFLYHKTKTDILDQPWYDPQEKRQPGWPEKFEHAKIEKVGEEPVKDTRLEIVKKWRRPLSEEKIRHPRDQK